MNDQTSDTSSSAVASLVLGIISFLFLGLLAGIPAVIFGHISLSNIKRDSLLAGRGMAISGLILGYLGVLWSLALILTLIFLMQSASTAEPFIYTTF